MKLRILPGALVALILLAGRTQAADSVWLASSGLLPQDTCPPWTAAASDSAPAFTPATLRVHTTACAKNALYLQQGADIQIPDTLVVEARLRVTARGDCGGVCGPFRDGAGLAITTAPSVGILFFVGVDRIFLTTGECTGLTTATVDTDGSPHTYRVTVLASGVVSVSYDGAPVLSGHTYASVNDHGATPRILWGEGTSYAYGTSYWESVRHNAHATGCATASANADAGSLETFASPNPFRQQTTLRFALARAGRVRVSLYDLAGRRIRRLEDADLAAGEQRRTWDGLDDAGRAVAPGAYFYRIRTVDGVRSGRVLRLP